MHVYTFHSELVKDFLFQGGLKAVIWTDALQMIVMVLGFVVVLIQTSIEGGGIEVLWKRAEEGSRIEFWK